MLDILAIEGDDRAQYLSQLVVTTHSPHILYERGFRPVRYFRRSSTAVAQSSEVLNLSAFYAQTAKGPRRRNTTFREAALLHVSPMSPTGAAAAARS